MRKRMKRRGQGELESEVLATLWAARKPLSPLDVHTLLGPELAYNTIQTILIRLFDKGIVGRESSGSTHRYQPVKAQADVAAEQMQAVLAGGTDHAAVLQRFVDALSADDAAALRRLVSPPTASRG